MLSYFFRLCLLLAFFPFAGCLGGPKVDPPGIIDNRTDGPGSVGSGDSTTTVDDSMDSGTAATINEPSEDTGGESEDGGATKQPDSGLPGDDDDAGSTREP